MKILQLSVLFLGVIAGQQKPHVEELPPLPGTTLLPVSVVTFDFKRAELKPPVWGFEIRMNGDSRYYERDTVTDNVSGDSLNRWQGVTVSHTTLDRILNGHSHMKEHCETSSKNIAKTGEKHLVYWSGDAPGGCIFNYSDDATIMNVADAFQAMAATIQTGQRLAHDHRFDRLSIDPDMEFLESEAKAGRAIEIQNIAAVLKSIIDDDRVIERARRRAARLLESSATPPAQL